MISCTRQITSVLAHGRDELMDWWQYYYNMFAKCAMWSSQFVFSNYIAPNHTPCENMMETKNHMIQVKNTTLITYIPLSCKTLLMLKVLQNTSIILILILYLQRHLTWQIIYCLLVILLPKDLKCCS